MRRIHQVCASTQTDDFGTDDFERWEKKAEKLVAYARRLGFQVLYENVDLTRHG